MIEILNLEINQENQTIVKNGMCFNVPGNREITMTIALDYMPEFNTYNEAKMHLLKMLMEEVQMDTSKLSDFYPEYFI